MADTKVETPNEDEVALKAELEADGELLDSEGKPLAWNHPKRVRQIYKDAKSGRQSADALKSLGIKAADVPVLRDRLERLAEFEEAEAAWEKKQAQRKGTTEEEDEEAVEDRKKAEKLRKQIKALGFKLEEPEEDAGQQAAREQQQHIAASVHKVRETVLDTVEAAGVELDDMDAADRRDFLEELDLKVGQKIKRTEGAREAILGGSMKFVKKFVNEILEAKNLGKAKAEHEVKGSGIKNLAPRVGGSHTPGKASVKKVDSPEPKNTREATEQMVAELAARRKAAAKGE